MQDCTINLLDSIIIISLHQAICKNTDNYFNIKPSFLALFVITIPICFGPEFLFS